MSGPREELEGALRTLESLPKRAKPRRQEARAVLVPLGAWILDEGETSAREAIDRVRRVTARFGDAFAIAVRDELLLACTEHVQSVDPRYLSLPNYDFEYTLEARERLEARLTAARALELEVPARELERVARADRLLAERLAKLGPIRGGDASAGAE